MTGLLAVHLHVGPPSIITVIAVGSAVWLRPLRRARRRAEPLRIGVRELRAHGLHRWPNAPGIYLAGDDRVHCRRCVDDPAARAGIVRGRDDAHQVLVLYGGPQERALVDASCASHVPAGHRRTTPRG